MTEENSTCMWKDCYSRWRKFYLHNKYTWDWQTSEQRTDQTRTRFLNVLGRREETWYILIAWIWKYKHALNIWSSFCMAKNIVTELMFPKKNLAAETNGPCSWCVWFFPSTVNCSTEEPLITCADNILALPSGVFISEVRKWIELWYVHDFGRRCRKFYSFIVSKPHAPSC